MNYTYDYIYEIALVIKKQKLFKTISAFTNKIFSQTKF